jgi:hypothetical protein
MKGEHYEKNKHEKFIFNSSRDRILYGGWL